MAAGVPRPAGESGHFYFGETGHFYLGTTDSMSEYGHYDKCRWSPLGGFQVTSSRVLQRLHRTRDRMRSWLLPRPSAPSLVARNRTRAVGLLPSGQEPRRVQSKRPRSGTRRGGVVIRARSLVLWLPLAAADLFPASRAIAEVSIVWVTVGDAGNAADAEVMTCCDPLAGTSCGSQRRC
jgi:hypothetical protein